MSKIADLFQRAHLAKQMHLSEQSGEDDDKNAGSCEGHQDKWNETNTYKEKVS